MKWFKKITDTLQGRTTTFLIMFFIVGNVLQFRGKLDLTYIAFFTAFMTAVIGHSLKEDLNPTTPPPANEAEIKKETTT